VDFAQSFATACQARLQFHQSISIFTRNPLVSLARIVHIHGHAQTQAGRFDGLACCAALSPRTMLLSVAAR